MKILLSFILVVLLLGFVSATPVEDITNWNKKYHSGGDYTYGTALDSSGNLYVVGGSRVSSDAYNWWIKKFSLNGIEDTTNWNKIVDSGNGNDLSNSIAIDSSNNVYVGGFGSNLVSSGCSALGASDIDWWIKKFNSAGTEMREWKFGSVDGAGQPVCEGNWIGDLAVDTLGNLYVIGVDYTTPRKARIKKYKADGSEDSAWDKAFSLNSGDTALFAVAVDSLGRVYVGGYGINLVSATSEWDWFIRRYSSTGTLDTTWNNNPTDLVKSQYGMIFDAGNLVIDNQGAMVSDIVIDASRNLYILGYSAGSDLDLMIKKIPSTGSTLSNNVRLSGNQGGSSLVLGSDNYVYVTGPGLLLDRFSKSTLLEDSNWRVVLSTAEETAFNGISVDSSNNVYLAGVRANLVSTNSAADWWIRKFSEGGNAPICGNGKVDAVQVYPSSSCPAQTASKIYWAEISYGIRSANLDGTGIQDLIPDLDANGVAVDLTNGKIYWSDNVEDNIKRANLDGTGVQTVVSSAGAYPYSIELDLVNNKIYWSDILLNNIKRSNIDGSNVQTIITGPPGGGTFVPRDIKLDVTGGKIYFVTGGVFPYAIWKANLDGSQLTKIADRPNVVDPIALDIDLLNNNLYYLEYAGNVRKINLDNPSFIQEIYVPTANLYSDIVFSNANNRIYLDWFTDTTGAPGKMVILSSAGSFISEITIGDKGLMMDTGSCYVYPGEQCDDGISDPGDTYYTSNNADDDGACVIDKSRNYQCRNFICGDGYLNSAIEQCDDGNTIDDGNGCSATCQNVVIVTCDNDGIKETGEGCDGNDFGSDSCNARGFVYGNLVCDSCVVDASGCTNTAPVGEITRVYWGGTPGAGFENKINIAYLEQNVYLIAETTFASGTMTFEVFEDDGVGELVDDEVRVGANALSGTIYNGRAVASLKIDSAIMAFGEGTDVNRKVELYFKAGSESEIMDGSNEILEAVNYENPIPDSVSICDQYTDENSCNSGFDEVANRYESYNCGQEINQCTTSCRCAWDIIDGCYFETSQSGTGCLASDLCKYTAEIIVSCEDEEGGQTWRYKQNGLWWNEAENRWEEHATKCPDSGEIEVLCLRERAFLDFFGWKEFIVSLVLIVLIYYIVFRFMKKKSPAHPPQKYRKKRR